jgi:hypothetical protein
VCDRCRKARERGRAPGEACCDVCGVSDVRVLAQVELEVQRTLCANCRTIRGRLPLTLAELRVEVLRELPGVELLLQLELEVEAFGPGLALIATELDLLGRREAAA